MRKWQLVSWIVLSSLTLLLASCGSEEGSNSGGADESIVLRGATAWPENDIQSIGFVLLKEKVEQASEGRIQFEYAGGPEAIPPFELADAVRTGVVDVAVVSTAYYQSQFPAATALGYSELSVEEERQSGALDYMNQLHNEKLNAQLLGRAGGEVGYSLYTKKLVENIEDFEGLRIRVAPIYVPLVQALGAEPITMPGGEIYQALERGVIDGFTWPEFGITALGLHEYTACQTQPSYWKVDTVNIMNLDTWNELSPELQKIVEQAAKEVEAEGAPAKVEEYIAEERQELEEAGVEVCEMADGAAFLQLANDSAWESMAENENIPEEQVGKLEELFRK